MIFDYIKNLDRYNIPFQRDMERFLTTMDVSRLTMPDHLITGRQLFVRLMHFRTKEPSEGKFETHQLYMDLQYVIKGAEIMETAPADVLEPLTEYDPEGDYRFFKADRNISRVLVRAGEFAVFFPGEAHRPCCSPVEGPGDVTKLVFKILMSIS